MLSHFRRWFADSERRRRRGQTERRRCGSHHPTAKRQIHIYLLTEQICLLSVLGKADSAISRTLLQAPDGHQWTGQQMSKELTRSACRSVETSQPVTTRVLRQSAVYTWRWLVIRRQKSDSELTTMM